MAADDRAENLEQNRKPKFVAQRVAKIVFLFLVLFPFPTSFFRHAYCLVLNSLERFGGVDSWFARIECTIVYRPSLFDHPGRYVLL